MPSVGAYGVVLAVVAVVTFASMFAIRRLAFRQVSYELLMEIRDPKSAEFVREKVLKAEKNQAAIGFLSAVISVLSGTDNGGEAQRIATKGIEAAVGTLGDIGGPSRKDRDHALFTPNGEFTPSKGRGR